MNFTVVVIFSVFAFGTGYVVGQAQRFGFFKFLIVLVFAGGFLTSGNDYYTMGVIFSFFAGLLVAKDIISFDMLDSVRYRLSSIGQFFQRTEKVKDQKEQQKKESTQRNSSDYEREREKRREQARERKENRENQEQKKKKSSNNQKSSENSKKQEYSRQNEQGQREKVEVKPDLRTPEQIIGVSGSYTKEELRKAYRRACSRCHSDKFANMSDSFKSELDEEFKKVQKAYDVLSKKFL